jgi:hypothetical protein
LAHPRTGTLPPLFATTALATGFFETDVLADAFILAGAFLIYFAFLAICRAKALPEISTPSNPTTRSYLFSLASSSSLSESEFSSSLDVSEFKAGLAAAAGDFTFAFSSMFSILYYIMTQIRNQNKPY